MKTRLTRLSILLSLFTGLFVPGAFAAGIWDTFRESASDGLLRFVLYDVPSEIQAGSEFALIFFRFLLTVLVFAIMYASSAKIPGMSKNIKIVISLIFAILPAILIPTKLILQLFEVYSGIIMLVLWAVPIIGLVYVNMKLFNEDTPTHKWLRTFIYLILFYLSSIFSGSVLSLINVFSGVESSGLATGINSVLSFAGIIFFLAFLLGLFNAIGASQRKSVEEKIEGRAEGVDQGKRLAEIKKEENELDEEKTKLKAESTNLAASRSMERSLGRRLNRWVKKLEKTPKEVVEHIDAVLVGINQIFTYMSQGGTAAVSPEFKNTLKEGVSKIIPAARKGVMAKVEVEQIENKFKTWAPGRQVSLDRLKSRVGDAAKNNNLDPGEKDNLLRLIKEEVTVNNGAEADIKRLNELLAELQTLQGGVERDVQDAESALDGDDFRKMDSSLREARQKEARVFDIAKEMERLGNAIQTLVNKKRSLDQDINKALEAGMKKATKRLEKTVKDVKKGFKKKR
jgi:hypothetical protein